MAVKALITAAGLGKRFGALTKRTNKCLLHIDGKSLIAHIVGRLRSHSINRICVVTGYQHSQVEREVGGSAECIYNPFYRVSGILGSFWAAKRELAGHAFVFTTADHWFNGLVLKDLLRGQGHLRIVVQKKKAYTTEDAKVIIRGACVIRLGKDIPSHLAQGEFGGMTYFSERASQLFFNELEHEFNRNGLHGYMMQVLTTLHHKHAMPIHYSLCSQNSRIEVDSVHDLIMARGMANNSKWRIG